MERATEVRDDRGFVGPWPAAIGSITLVVGVTGLVQQPYNATGIYGCGREQTSKLGL